VQVIRETKAMDEFDEQTLREMITYTKDENGAYNAQPGYHDDLVISLAIAHFISSQQRATWSVTEPVKAEFITSHFSIKQPSKNGMGGYWK